MAITFTSTQKDLCGKTFTIGKRILRCDLYQKGGRMIISGNCRKLSGVKILEALKKEGADVNSDEWFLKKRESRRIIFLKK